MPVTRGLGTTGDGAGTVTPLDHKLAQSGLVTKQGAQTNLVRSGLFWDGLTNIVGGRANMAYDVRPFTAVLSRGAAAGAVLLSNDGVVQVATTAAPGSNSRIDVVYVWQREFSLDGVNSNPVIGVLQGTAAVSPVAPSLAAFPGAIELARIVVPAGVTATNSGTTITQTSRFTANSGGVVYFRNTTERDEAATTVPNGTIGFVETDDSLWVNVEGVWRLTGEDTGWIAPTMKNNWVSASARYRRLDGVVYLRGRVAESSAGFNNCFDLPAGFRPATEWRQPVFAGDTWPGGTEMVQIETNGAVSLNRFQDTTKSLDGVRFPVG